MIEIDLNATFDARVATARRKLARVVTNTESSIATKVRSTPQVTNEDIKTCEEIVRNFLGVYESLSEELEKREIFHREKENSYFELIHMHSLYAGSKAVLNKLNDESVERIRSYEAAPPQVSLTYSDVNQKSEYNSLEKILNDLSNISKKNNAAALKYAYFTFFDKIRDLAKSYIATYCNVDTLNELNQLQIFKTGLDFHEISPPKKKEFQNEKAVADTSFKEGLPSELSPYHLVNPPTLDRAPSVTQLIRALTVAEPLQPMFRKARTWIERPSVQIDMSCGWGRRQTRTARATRREIPAARAQTPTTEVRPAPSPRQPPC